MAKNAGTLSISILARTGKFRKGMRQARRELKQFSRKVFSMGAGLTAVATGGGLGFFIKKQFEAIDVIAKVSAKLGLQTQELQALRKASNEAGIDTRTLDMGIQRMARRIGEFMQGTGEAKATLEAFGFTAEQLGKKTTFEQFLLIADKIDAITNANEKLVKGFKLFDSEAVGVILAMRGGSAALEKYLTRVEELGIAISSVDSTKIEIANDKFGDMKDVITGVGQRIAVDLAGPLFALADGFVKTSIEGGNMGDKIGGVMDNIAEKVGQAKIAFDVFTMGIKTVQGVILTLGSGIAKVLEFITDPFDKKEGFFAQLSNDFMNASSEIKTESMVLKGTIKKKLGTALAGGESPFATWIDKARAEMEKLAKDFKKELGTALDPLGAGAVDRVGGIREKLKALMAKAEKVAGAEIKTTQGRQIDLRHTFLGGLDPRDNEKKKQLETLREIRDEIRTLVRNTSGPASRNVPVMS